MNYQKVTAYSAAFVAVTWACLLAFIGFIALKETVFSGAEEYYDEVRHEHPRQHDSEQAQFARIIALLEEISAKLDRE